MRAWTWGALLCTTLATIGFGGCGSSGDDHDAGGSRDDTMDGGGTVDGDGGVDSGGDARPGNPLTVESIALGEQHTCALLGDGRVKCWGDNYSGELGFKTTATCPVPARNGAMKPCSETPKYVDGLANAVGIALQSARSYAWLKDGTAWRWGADELQSAASVSPVAIAGLANVAQVAAGVAFACARLVNGTVSTVSCWGANNNGNLGDGTTIKRTTPAAVKDLSGVSQIAAGQAHACALLANGTVSCWGANNAGQLGSATTTTCAAPDAWPCATEPAPVPGLAGVLQITAGEYHTCALLGDHTVQCWGDNQTAELGRITAQACAWGGGNPPCGPSPLPVTGLANVAQIAAGWYYTCARLQGGTVQCWGLNKNGQLGYPTMTSCSGSAFETCGLVPAAVTGLANVVELGVGRSRHTCARLEGGVRCWGLNNAGQLGSGTTTDEPVPTPDASVAW